MPDHRTFQKPVKIDPAKQERFIRAAHTRVARILKDLGQLAALEDQRLYNYTDAEIEDIGLLLSQSSGNTVKALKERGLKNRDLIRQASKTASGKR